MGRFTFPWLSIALVLFLVHPIVLMTLRAREADVNLWPIIVALIILVVGGAIAKLRRYLKGSSEKKNPPTSR